MNVWDLVGLVFGWIVLGVLALMGILVVYVVVYAVVVSVVRAVRRRGVRSHQIMRSGSKP